VEDRFNINIHPRPDFLSFCHLSKCLALTPNRVDRALGRSGQYAMNRGNFRIAECVDIVVMMVIGQWGCTRFVD
jgi:hypothetical protein